MSPTPLSSAPVIVEGRTMVPVEFFTETRGYGIVLQDGVLSFLTENATTHRGYIREVIANDRDGDGVVGE